MLVLACVRSHPQGRMSLDQLKNDLLKQQVNLKKIAYQHKTPLIHILQSFSDVIRVTTVGYSAFIEPLTSDHITNMNRFSR
jgi:hypothetical protein